MTTNMVTSTENPALFGNCPTLPTGFTYLLYQTGVYDYGQYRDLYKIGVSRDADDIVVWGDPFYPNPQYASAQNMVDTEGTNAYNLWDNYYQADSLETAAIALIGF